MEASQIAPAKDKAAHMKQVRAPLWHILLYAIA